MKFKRLRRDATRVGKGLKKSGRVTGQLLLELGEHKHRGYQIMAETAVKNPVGFAADAGAAAVGHPVPMMKRMAKAGWEYSAAEEAAGSAVDASTESERSAEQPDT